MRISPAFVVILVSATWIPAASAQQPWFPLAAGNSWEFVTIIDPPFAPPDTSGAGTMTIDGPVTIGSHEYFTTSMPIGGFQTLRYDGANVVGLLDGEEYLLLDFSRSDRESYPLIVKRGSPLDTLDVRVSSSPWVITPADRFRFVRGFHAVSRNWMDSGWSVELASGVGPVRITDGQGQEVLLKQAVVNGQEYPSRLLASEVTTDKSVYASGEPIRLTLRVENVGNTEQHLSTYCNQPTYEIDDLVMTPEACILWNEHWFFQPGSWREWTWTHDPTVLGLSDSPGGHLVTARYGNAVASTYFEAPAFLGGHVDVLIANTMAPAAVQDIRSTLNAVVLSSEARGAGSTMERWAISGISMEDAVSRYASHSGVSIMVNRSLDLSSLTTTRRDAPYELPTAFAPSVFPNPADRQVTFRSQAVSFSVRLFDVLGRQVAGSGETPVSAAEVGIQTDALPPGVYVYRLISNGHATSGTLVVVH